MRDSVAPIGTPLAPTTLAVSVPYLDLTTGAGDPWFFSPTIARLAQDAIRLSRRNAPVFILGALGSRPERNLLALTVHNHSNRAHAAFTKLTWEYLSESFVESQLFGTGRSGPMEHSPGLIRESDGGTLYIEEIARFSLATQGKLASFLETGRYRAAGNPYEQLADVRIIAGTGHPTGNAPPNDKLLSDLRSDLLPNALTIPPLRDRPEEIAQIAHQLNLDYAHETGRHAPNFSAAAIDALSTYTWPNNTEELARSIKQAADIATEGRIELHHLPSPILEVSQSPPSPPANLRQTLERIERTMIVQALQASGGNQTRAAKTLGISERLMGLRVRKYKLDPKTYRTKS